MFKPTAGFVRAYVVAAAVVGAAAVAAYGAAAAPAGPATAPAAPATGPADLLLHRADVLALRRWWYGVERPPDAADLARFARLVDAHPDGAESAFFLCLPHT